MLGEEGGRAQTTRGTGGLREYTSEDREGGMEGERGMATGKRVGRNDSGGKDGVIQTTRQNETDEYRCANFLSSPSDYHNK